MVLEEGVPYIFCHSGRGQNVALAFFITLGIDSIVECVAVVPDQPESAKRELAWRWVGTDSDYLLEQLHPVPVFVLTPYYAFIVLL